MSISAKLADALMLTRALPGRQLRLSDFPAAASFQPKAHLVKCRRCDGIGTEGESAANCPQCGGKGVEKLSMKALRREAVKIEAKKIMDSQAKENKP